MAVDWLAIRNDYINGRGSYRELSKKYCVPESTIRKRGAAEKWVEDRNRFGTHLEQKTVEKTAEAVAEAIAEEAAMKVKLRTGLLKLAVDWVGKQEEIGDTSDYRRMVQSCIELGILDVENGAGTEDDGLIAALGSNARTAFCDGDDSAMLPEDRP